MAAVLQLSTAHKMVLVDVNALCESGAGAACLAACLHALLTDQEVLKLGFGLSQDLAVLARTLDRALDRAPLARQQQPELEPEQQPAVVMAAPAETLPSAGAGAGWCFGGAPCVFPRAELHVGVVDIRAAGVARAWRRVAQQLAWFGLLAVKIQSAGGNIQERGAF